MAKTGGLGERLAVAGYDLSGDIGALSKIGGGPAALDLTDITESAYERQGGLRDGGIDFTAYYDPAANQAHPVLSALPTTDEIVTFAHGTAIGGPAASEVAKQIGYDPARGQDGSLTFAVSTQANGFGVEWGVQLTPWIRTDTVATAASAANSVDTLTAAAFGGQAYFQLFAFTGTSVTISIWDSADNVTFSAVAGFTTAALASAPQAVRDTIANTATIRRYVAVATAGTFSNAQFAVMLNKNMSAGVSF